MSFERRPDGNYDYIPPNIENIVFPDGGVVEARGELLPLCKMCKYSRLTCENEFIREVEVPADNPDDEIIGYKKQPDGSYKKQGLGFKLVDGFKEGIYKSEDDIPIPFVCEYFKPKDLG